MTVTEAVVRPPNSLLLIGDPSALPPKTMGDSRVHAAPGCVAVGTLSDADGESTVRLLGGGDREGLPHELAFSGELEVTSGCLTVSSVLDDVYLEQTIEKSPVSVEVWVNDPSEPDAISIVVD